MGTTLTGTTPQDTYDSLIKVTDNAPLTGSLKKLTDGLGNDSSLSLSTGAASVTGTLAVTAGTNLATASGNVGIGTAAPTAKLMIADLAITTTTALLVETAAQTTGHTAYLYSNSAQSGNTLRVYQDGAGSTGAALHVYSDGAYGAVFEKGNVGIGTSAPTSSLDVVSAGTTVAEFEGAANATVSFKGSGFVEGLIRCGGEFTIGSTNNFPITFLTNNTEKVRILAGGGLTFNGDTAAANALDDYEEGTFTPTIAGSTTAGTATYVNRVGVYTKIGRQVSLQIDLGWNSGTGTGNLIATGLPFTDTSNTNPAITIGFFDGIPLTASNYALAFIPSLTTTIDFVQTPVGGGALTSIAYDAAGRVILNVTYTA